MQLKRKPLGTPTKIGVDIRDKKSPQRSILGLRLRLVDWRKLWLIPVLVGGFLLFYGFFRMKERSNVVDCRNRYAAARSATDSAEVDRFEPATIRKRDEPRSPTCGMLRQLGKLQ
jgi:hypothetical protein